MHQLLLNAYNNELQYLRDVGAEFAKAHPRIGAALGLNSSHNSDPMIERLLEGLAFLTARISHRIDTEHGRLKADLLQCLMPDLLLAIPPTTIVEFVPVPTLSPGSGQIIKRGSALRYRRMGARDIGFCCANEVLISPIKISTLESPSQALLSKLTRSAIDRGLIKSDIYRGALRIELRSLGNQNLRSCVPNKLRIYCGGQNGLAIWNVLTNQSAALLLVDPKDGGFLYSAHPFFRLEPAGFEDDESLLPPDCILPGPLHLLREWRHYPNKFNFVDLMGLEKSIAEFKGSSIELWFLYGDEVNLSPDLETDSLKLHCATAVNLFMQPCEPIVMRETKSEYPLKLPDSDEMSSNIITLSRADYRDSEGHWHELTPLSAGFDEDAQYRYSLRADPRWKKNEVSKKFEGAWEWKISPAPMVSDEEGARKELLCASAWCYQNNSTNLLAEEGWLWKLDVAAPIKLVRGAGPFVQASQKPPLEDLLPGSIGIRMDLLRDLSSPELATRLREWLNLFSLEEYGRGIEQATIDLEVRRVPKESTPIYARGWVIRLGVDNNLAAHPRLAQWTLILAKTIGKQLQSESFVECQFERQHKRLTVASVWQ